MIRSLRITGAAAAAFALAFASTTPIFAAREEKQQQVVRVKARQAAAIAQLQRTLKGMQAHPKGFENRLKHFGTYIEFLTAKTPAARHAIAKSLGVTIAVRPTPDGVYRDFIAGGKVRHTVFEPASSSGTGGPRAEETTAAPRHDDCYWADEDYYGECASKDDLNDALSVAADAENEAALDAEGAENDYYAQQMYCDEHPYACQTPEKPTSGPSADSQNIPCAESLTVAIGAAYEALERIGGFVARMWEAAGPPEEIASLAATAEILWWLAGICIFVGVATVGYYAAKDCLARMNGLDGDAIETAGPRFELLPAWAQR